MSLQNTTNCLHTIKLLNLQDNETIPHRFLLIKGAVEGRKCYADEQIALFLDDKQQKQQQLSANYDSRKFKYLLDLGEVEQCIHKIRLEYCSAKLELSINYKQKQSVYGIQPLIIIAQDEDEEEDEHKVTKYQEIIDMNLFLVQLVYAEKLNELSKGRLCFNFKNRCRMFKSCLSKKEIWTLKEHDLWSSLAKEILQTDWGRESTIKFVAFIACSKYLGDEVQKSKDFSYENIRKHMLGHVACGAGGLALFSSSYFYAWPQKFDSILSCFNDKKKIDLSQEPDDSNYRKTYGGVYASSLGAVCHEIGHIFDLGHDLEGVMGSNFDYINHVFVVHETTEHLPRRIVMQTPETQMPKQQRFTQIKKTPAQGFLNSYREQKENDLFYFSANSAIILSHHPWLRCEDQHDQHDFMLDFSKEDFVVKSSNYALKLIEIRTNSNSLIKHWFDLQKCGVESSGVMQYDLSRYRKQLENECHLFVMSIKGHCKKIWI
ncbi:uncharacterized protein LOC133320992 [Musca vetustissima]|uniref:uncharacterized protein LOC133320992 n=1 Tax=Musca vetustissima TaxID=27455 RepID=UPI002AB70DEE|nr:uncharacterized protein LOC133320992 [Musca vetustissima]